MKYWYVCVSLIVFHWQVLSVESLDTSNEGLKTNQIRDNVSKASDSIKIEVQKLLNNASKSAPQEFILHSHNNKSLREEVIKSEKQSNADVKKKPLPKTNDLKDHMKHINIVRQHEMQLYNKELRTKGEKGAEHIEKKGKLQVVGGVFGDIIGVIISEVVRLFGELVGDLARELTAHSFVSMIEQFSGFS